VYVQPGAPNAPYFGGYPAPGGGPVAAYAEKPVRDEPPHERLGPLDSHFLVSANLDVVWYTGKSFDLFSDKNDAVSPGLSLGYTLWLDKSLAVVPEVGWSTSNQSASSLFGGAISRTELGAQRAYAGASLRYGVVSFLDAHGRVAGGASFLHATVQPSGGSPSLEDTGTSPFVSFGGGVTLHSPGGSFETQHGSLRSLVAGVVLEGGYELAEAVELRPAPTGDTGRVATSYMSFGTLERSGPYFRTSLVVRF
jgi:hypothetical protein